jgi:DNA-binding transcriptional MerR regulator
MSKSLHIGELSERTGRSIHSIRWYESQGLIPGVLRDQAGRRVYSELHVNWLELIDRLRQTGMSIAAMREYTALVKQGSPTLRHRQKLLSDHRTRIREKLSEWTLALNLIDHKIDLYGEWITTGHCPKELLPQASSKRAKKGTPTP